MQIKPNIDPRLIEEVGDMGANLAMIKNLLK